MVGWNKIAGTGGSHLVFFNHHLGKPGLVIDPGNGLVVILGQDHKIAVVIVSHIFVIDLRKGGSFIFGAHIFLIIFTIRSIPSGL